MFRVVCLSLMCLVSSAVQAQITVSRSIFEFTADESIQDLDLLNSADFRIFLNLTVDEIVDPHTDSAVRKPNDDPRTADVLISPNKLVIAPGQRKRVRIVSRRSPGEADRIYRLAVKPHVGKIAVDEVGRNRKRPAIKVLLGYDLLLIVRPQEPKPMLDVDRSERTLTFRNMGNTNIMLQKIEQCRRDGSDCEPLPGNRLYAGEELTVELPMVGSSGEFPVETWQNDGFDTQRVSY